MSIIRKIVSKLGSISSRQSLSPLSCDGSAPVQKRYNSHVVKDGRPFRMAVIGSGPAGFYTAYKVMSSIQNSMVDMYESLPAPFGLVRFGVAPDHPEVKVKHYPRHRIKFHSATSAGLWCCYNIFCLF